MRRVRWRHAVRGMIFGLATAGGYALGRGHPGTAWVLLAIGLLLVLFGDHLR